MMGGRRPPGGRAAGLWTALLGHCLAAAGPAGAFTLYSCGPGCAPRWPAGRVALHANAEAGPCDLAAMERAIARWNAALARVGGPLQVVLAGRTPQYGLRRNGVNSAALLVAGWPKAPHLFGWTSLWWQGSRLVEGDMAFNLQGHPFRCDTRERRGREASLEQEMLHELGHFLGLDHAPAGVMRHQGFGTEVDGDALEGLRRLYGR